MSLMKDILIALLAWGVIRGIESSGPSIFNFTPKFYDIFVIIAFVFVLSFRDQISEIRERVQQWIIRHGKLVMISCTVITIPFFAGIFQLTVQPVFDGDLPEDDPKVISYEAYEQLKDEHSFVLTVFSPLGKLLNLEGFLILDEMSNSAEELPGVDPSTILSINNIRTVVSVDEDTVDIRKLEDKLDDIEDDQEREKALQSLIRDHPLAHGRLISSSEQLAAVQVRYDPDIDRMGLHRQSMKLVEELDAKYPKYQFGVAGFDILEQQISLEIIFMATVLSTVAVVGMILLLSYFFGVYREGEFDRGALSGVLFAMGPLTFFPVIWVMGGLGWAGIPIDTVSAVIPIVFIAIASSYGVHTFHHITHADLPFNEDRVLYGCNKVARALFTSSVTTAIGFITLMPFAIESIKKFGIFSALGVMLMLGVAYLCTPAWFAMWPATSTPREFRLHGFLGRVKRVYRHPIAAALVILTVVIPVGVQGRKLEIGSSPTEFLAPGDVIRETSELLTKELNANGAIFIAAEAGGEGDVYEPEFLEKLQALSKMLIQHPAVSFTQDFSEEEIYLNERYAEDEGLPDSREAASQLMFVYEMVDSSQFADFTKSTTFMIVWGDYVNSHNVDEIYELVKAFADEHDMELTVGSEYVLWSAQTDYIVRGKVVSWIQSLLLIFLLGWVVFRDWQAGVIIITPLAIAITLNLGLMATFGIPLDIASTVITSITIGVGADYAIHVYNGIRQEAGADMTERLDSVIDHSAPPIMYDGISDIIGFSVFLLSALQPVKHCGAMLILGMFIACAGALVIVPLLAKLKTPTQPA